MTKNIALMRNLGPTSAEWLKAVGIDTPDQLHEFGALEVYLLVKAAFPKKATLHLLWALEGALVDLDWRDIPPQRKDELRAELDAATSPKSPPRP